MREEQGIFSLRTLPFTWCKGVLLPAEERKEKLYLVCKFSVLACIHKLKIFANPIEQCVSYRILLFHRRQIRSGETNRPGETQICRVWELGVGG